MVGGEKATRPRYALRGAVDIELHLLAYLGHEFATDAGPWAVFGVETGRWCLGVTPRGAAELFWEMLPARLEEAASSGTLGAVLNLGAAGALVEYWHARPVPMPPLATLGVRDVTVRFAGLRATEDFPEGLTARA